MNSDAYLSKRLFAALTASCLLHAVVIVLPYLGASTTVSRSASRGVQKPGPARVLSVRLLAESEPATVAGSRASEASAAAVTARPGADVEPRPAVDRTRGIDLLPIPAPAYYTSDQLTKRPRPTAEPNLLVPEIWPIFAAGKVVLKLWINERGNVVSVEVEKSDLPDAISGSAAAAFGKLRFAPGEINGRPVGTMMRIEVTYDDDTKRP